MNKIKYIYLVSFLLLLWGPGFINAQVVCSGPACSNMPLSPTELNTMLAQFQYQYSDVLLKDMSEAGNSAVLTGTPGSPLMNGNYYGSLTLPIGYEARHDVWIVSPKYQSGTALESAGVAFLPRLQFGYRHPPSGKSEESDGGGKSGGLLSRFEIYGSYFNYTIEKKVKPEFDPGQLMNVNMGSLLTSGQTELNVPELMSQNMGKSIVPSDGYQLKWYHIGFMGRFRILENYDLAGRMVEFAGLSASVGYYEDRFALGVLINNQKNNIKVSSGDGIEWKYSMLADYNMSTKTIPMEVRSGITLFTFLQLNGGVGYAYTIGNYKINTILAGNAEVIPGDVLGQIALAMAPPTGPTYLGFSMRSSENINEWRPYFRPGIEFHMGAVRIAFEGIMMKGAADSFIINFAVDI